MHVWGRNGGSVSNWLRAILIGVFGGIKISVNVLHNASNLDISDYSLSDQSSNEIFL